MFKDSISLITYADLVELKQTATKSWIQENSENFDLCLYDGMGYGPLDWQHMSYRAT